LNDLAGRARVGETFWANLPGLQGARSADSVSKKVYGVRFELFVAARYLRAKRRQAVVGIITLISVIGVAAGVASLIIALAINNGFPQDLQGRLLGSRSHVNLLGTPREGISNWRPLMAPPANQQQGNAH